MSENWESVHSQRVKSAHEALGAIRSGSRVFMAAGCGRPQLLIDTLVEMRDKFTDLELIHMMGIGLAPAISPEYLDRIRHNALFIRPGLAEAVSDGRADFTPVSKYQISRLLRERRIPIDVTLIQVSPPDEDGFVSMGITVGISKAAAEVAGHVIAEVNPNMPRTRGDSLLPVEMIDALVPSTRPLIEAPPREVDEVADEIARHCSRLIDDDATLHVGYTPVAFALPRYLQNRQNLGIHTDVLTTPLMDLMRAGVVTNASKAINRGKTITSLCYGTRADYDRIANRPGIEFYPAEYVNNPCVVAEHLRMIAINEARKIDLTGLVCARFRGPRFGSGFMYGASFARHGRSIVTLPSTRENGTVSNIVADLDPAEGIAISTNRDEVQFAITEYGIADLAGKSIRERTLALIHIAHPDFRDELMEAAKERNYIYSNQIPQRHKAYPDRHESRLTLKDGTLLYVRPARPTDERMVQTFLYRMDEDSIRYRFHGKLESLHRDRVQEFVNVDYEGAVTLLVFLADERGERPEVIAIGQYLHYAGTGAAEAAFTTDHEYRSRGIATYLFKELIKMAREQKIDRMFAEVLRENQAMLAVFRRGGVPAEFTFEDGLHHVSLDIGGATESPAEVDGSEETT